MCLVDISAGDEVPGAGRINYQQTMTGGGVMLVLVAIVDGLDVGQPRDLVGCRKGSVPACQPIGVHESFALCNLV